MKNYKTTNLDEFLMPKDAPITTIGGVSSYDFDSLNERAVITAAKLAANAVGTFSIGTAQIITTQIADLAVTNGKLGNDSVTAAKIAGSAVGETEISPGAVVAGKIPASTIAGTHVTAGVIAGTHIASGAVAGTHIAASSIAGTHMATSLGTSLILNSATGSIGFYGATPIGQPGTIADATDGTNVITQLNALLGTLRVLGLIDS